MDPPEKNDCGSSVFQDMFDLDQLNVIDVLVRDLMRSRRPEVGSRPCLTLHLELLDEPGIDRVAMNQAWKETCDRYARELALARLWDRLHGVNREMFDIPDFLRARQFDLLGGKRVGDAENLGLMRKLHNAFVNFLRKQAD